jgi:hypothetical protein
MLRTLKGVGALATRSYHALSAVCGSMRIRQVSHSPNVIKYLNNPSKWSITGNSVSGLATSLYLVEPQIMVDAGTFVKINDTVVIPNDLLITHHHGDHNRVMGQHAKNNVTITDPVTEHHHNLGEKQYNMNVMNIIARTFELDHTVKCVGYGIESNINGKSQKEVLMMGDTRIDPFYEIKELLDYPVVVVECTNYDPEPHRIRMYKTYGHLSWLELRHVIKQNPDIYFHLIHPSSKLSRKQKWWIQKNLIEKEVHNAHMWIDY